MLLHQLVPITKLHNMNFTNNTIIYYETNPELETT